MEEIRAKCLIELDVNGQTHAVAVEPQETLLEVLRGRLGLTGAKEGCGSGECGSCTVLLDGQPVLACLLLALDSRGHAVTTIEGLSQGKRLTAVQESFLEQGAVQCGFCTPGMVLAASALLERNHAPSENDVKQALAGHLCRCTGYNKILAAVAQAGARIRGGRS